MDQTTVDIIKATAGVVGSHAEEITKLFYKTMFANSPVARTFFNTANQASLYASPCCPVCLRFLIILFEFCCVRLQNEGRQAKALAASIIAYATHIDDLGALTAAIELIVAKHCGLQVLPEHYPIVHDNLLIAVGTVLGDAVTPEVAGAWSTAVNFLAKVLYDAEEVKYKAAEARSGGWRGWKDFTVSAIDNVSSDCKTFTFSPADGVIPQNGYEFTPGQYLSVRVDVSTPRHYTVTSQPGEKFLQITTKRLGDGAVSSFMHDKMAIGDTIKLSPPFGSFAIQEGGKPVVLLSAGIGMTPMKAFLDSNPAAVVKAVHVDKRADSIPFLAHFEKHNAGKNVFFFTGDGQGRPDIGQVIANLTEELGVEPVFYVCGPTSFMRDVVHGLLSANIPKNQIAWEAFAPQLSCPV